MRLLANVLYLLKILTVKKQGQMAHVLHVLTDSILALMENVQQ